MQQPADPGNFEGGENSLKTWLTALPSARTVFNNGRSKHQTAEIPLPRLSHTQRDTRSTWRGHCVGPETCWANKKGGQVTFSERRRKQVTFTQRSRWLSLRRLFIMNVHRWSSTVWLLCLQVVLLWLVGAERRKQPCLIIQTFPFCSRRFSLSLSSWSDLSLRDQVWTRWCY